MTPKHFYSEETGENIITVISKYPGLGLRELARELGISPQSLKYYTDNLIKEERIIVKIDGKYKRFYEKDFKIEELEQKILICLRKAPLLNIIIILLNIQKKGNKGIVKNQELIEKLQVQSAGTITYYVNQLIENGIIEKVKDGFRLTNVSLIESLIKKYLPTPSIVDNFIKLWTDYFQ